MFTNTNKDLGRHISMDRRVGRAQKGEEERAGPQGPPHPSRSRGAGSEVVVPSIPQG